jgi:hypothetical protein
LFSPTKIETKTELNEVKVKDKDIDKNTQTTITETHHKDGSYTKNTVISNKDQIEQHETDAIKKKEDKVTEYSNGITSIELGARIHPLSLSGGYEIDARVGRTIFGPVGVYVGGSFDPHSPQNFSAGAGLTLFFK